MDNSIRDSFKLTKIFRDAASFIAAIINAQTRKNNIRVRFYEFFPNGNIVFRAYHGLDFFQIILIPIACLNDPKELEGEINKNIKRLNKIQWGK